METMSPSDLAEADQYITHCREFWGGLPDGPRRNQLLSLAKELQREIAELDPDRWAEVAGHPMTMLLTQRKLWAEAAENPDDLTEDQLARQIYIRGMMAFLVYEYVNTGRWLETPTRDPDKVPLGFRLGYWWRKLVGR